MSIIAILIDIITTGAYFFQAQSSMARPLLMVGTGFQILMTLVLLVMCFSYQGRRRHRYWTDTYHPFTFRFGIIALSFVVNALVAVLYVFNIMGINSVIFSR
ncbi:hypothetical protein [Lacticaseibacillus zhaodongensis]|uniref:hypothetical protein n=1 Tax=Lacticaseibacillus zhaodongensis TaxID=2668065 RepID=UPI0012D2D87F|nr:hypothetical protein [Lacticaseibacillus zhaodongensis]